MPWEELLGWMAVASAAMFVGSLLLLPLLIVAMPYDYFSKPPGERSWRSTHPIVRWGIRGLKNVLGALFLLAGAVMLLTPGQGILCILIGLALVDLPGKRKIEVAILRRDKVLAGINAIRAKAGRRPLELPEEER